MSLISPNLVNIRSNNQNNIGLLGNKPNTGPVKIQSNDFLRKPMTPDTMSMTQNSNNR